MKTELRQLVARHVYRPDIPFSLAQTGPGAYDAIFPGNKLPSINYDGLKRHLSAKAAFNETADKSGYDAVVFEGCYQDHPVVLYMCASTPVESP
jgi:hypothetical protein